MARLKTPSPQQLEIFRWTGMRLPDGTGIPGPIVPKGSLVIIAVAGSGKTTTLVEMAHLIPSYMQCSFVAFNKSVAEELKLRLPGHFKAQTLNSMGFGAWCGYVGKGAKLEVQSYKTKTLMRNNMPQNKYFDHIGSVPKLVALAKSIGLVPQQITADGFCQHIVLTHDTDEVWQSLIDHHQIEIKPGMEKEAIYWAREMLTKSIEVGKELIDYDDQLYLPVIHNAKFWGNDWLFVDEAQDVNLIQREMLRRALKLGGRLVAVGDPCQAIYGFRGADVDSIENIKKEFGARELPLTVSYRCPQMVVAEAQKYVKHITAAETNPTGVVRRQTDKYNHELFQTTDVILCRNSAPLVNMIFRLLRNGVGAKILGRDIGQGVITLIEQMRARTIEELEDKLGEYRNREVQKLIKANKDEQADILNDKVDTILAFVANLPEDKRFIPGLISQIEDIFADKQGKGLLTLCTIHKAKGLEFPRVFILDADTLMPSKWARKPWQQVQETNLHYVAVTRAQQELVYLSSAGFEDKTKAPVVQAPTFAEQLQSEMYHQLRDSRPSDLITNPPAGCTVSDMNTGRVVAQGPVVGWGVTKANTSDPQVALREVAGYHRLVTAAEFQIELSNRTGEAKWDYSRELAAQFNLKADYSPDERINHMQRCMAIKKYLKGVAK